MMFKRTIPAALVATLCWIAALCSCSQFDDVVFNEGTPQQLAIQAYFSKNLDSNTVGIKSDTIHPGDSIILLTSVYPSKAIRSKEYYWTMDGNFYCFEYNCKRAEYKPGHHQFNFIFVDYFGDTLKDSLDLYIGSVPLLDKRNFIPANNTQYFAPSDFINFAWNVYDPDSMWDMSHHFVLKEAPGYYGNPKVLVDTILHEASFTYLKGFDNLGMYQWSVSVQNELRQKAQDTIRSTFSTRGIRNEAALFGFINHSSSEQTLPFHLWLTNSDGYMVYDDTVFSTKGSAFVVKPLNPGKYTLYAMAQDYTDFGVDTTKFEIKANQVLTLDTIEMKDTTPPRITAIGSYDGESLDYSDTLKFVIKDFGGKVLEKRIKVALDADNISSFHFSNDTLFVSISELKNSWATRIVSITAYDYSSNKAKKSFKVLPSKTLPEVFSE
ncbi:MAG: hypothetical protein HUK19_00080 [Fibrobacter sp.]|nr:hypothetical protein [Fibrobacter sp.]